jgi:essential nuclear protein 1
MHVKVILDPKTSRRIFELARDQQEEFEMPDDEAEVESSTFSAPRPQIQDDDDDDDMQTDAGSDEYVDEVVVSATMPMVFRNVKP